MVDFDEIDRQAAIVAKQRKKIIEENLPSWAQVETACDNISNLTEAKAYIKKLTLVVYLLSKNKVN
jgi:hypothetical protein